MNGISPSVAGRRWVIAALRQFESIPAVVKRLGSAQRVGLGYLALGQRAGTLSGGEAQRLALARELGQGGAGETLYLLDEPTRGLHGTDVDALTDVLQACSGGRHSRRPKRSARSVASLLVRTPSLAYVR